MKRARGPMVVALVACALLFLAVLWWFKHLPGPTTHAARFLSPTSDGAAPIAGSRVRVRAASATLHDRAARDVLRRRILEAWLGARPEESPVFDSGVSVALAMPVLDGGTVDPTYLRERISQDLLPLARSCYVDLLTRQPTAGGRSMMEFVIVGDERFGAVVDEVNVESGDGGLAEAGFVTCLRESMYSLALRRPPGRGSIRVRYPLTFSSDEPIADDPSR